ncbi:MAG: hypothetical protein Q4F31_01805 [Eubacteriales bacterium]|nr:hypothetical protein [Eubacteriales bacterium]
MIKKTHNKISYSTIFVNFFFFLTILFFTPMEIYIGNISEFSFPPDNVWWILLIFAVLLSVGISIIESLFIKLQDYFNCILFSLGVCFYLQRLFFNSHLQTLTGELIQFSKSVVYSNIIIWLLIFSSLFSILMYLKRSKSIQFLHSTLLIAAAELCVIQFLGFGGAIINMEDYSDDDIYLSTSGEFELSPKNNVLYFILDTCDGQFVREALETDPDLFSEFTGFTYYPNATTTYSRTYPAIPYLLTKSFCDFSKPYKSYIDEAYEKSDFLNLISAHDTDIRIYTSTHYLSHSVYNLVDNLSSYDSGSLQVLSPLNLIKSMIRISGYQGMPYLLKPLFSYTVEPINRNVMKNIPEDYFTKGTNEFEFSKRLNKQGVTTNDSYDSAFRFYHLFGPHPGCIMNSEAHYDPNATQVDTLRGDIKILNEYFSYMKELGIYDNSTIIITADHGNQNESEDLLLHQPPCCIMLVKEAGKGSSFEIQTSSSPVCQDDLFSVVLNALGISSSKYGEAIYEISEDSARDRYYYHTAQINATNGEVALREYKISGNAEDFSNWQLTGKYWDIIHSANAVSKTRLNTQ